MATTMAQNITIRMMKDNVEQLSLQHTRSGSFNPGLMGESIDYVGFLTPVPRGFNGECTLEVQFDPDRPEWVLLMDYQRKKNLGIELDLANTYIDIMFSVDFGKDGVSRILMPKTVMTVSDGFSMNGRTDLVGASASFLAGTWVLIS